VRDEGRKMGHRKKIYEPDPTENVNNKK